MKPFVSKKHQQLLIETSAQRIAEVFYKNPEREFSLSDLAKEARVAKAHIGGVLDNLLKMQFIEIIKLTNIWRIKANQRNWFFLRSKIIYNLNFVYQSGIVEFLNDKYKNPKVIILFGSFRRGEDISTSDIDIAIESDDFKDYEIIQLQEIKGFEKIISRKVQIHLFNRKHVDLNVFNNIANGIVLFGFLEVNV